MDNIIIQGPSQPLVKIISGDYEVIASGSFLTANADSAEIYIADLCFELRFHKTNGPLLMKASSDNSGKKITLDLDNFGSLLGSGSSKPLEVGTAQNRKLYFSFKINAYDQDSIKEVVYTFYLGGKINV